MLGKRQKLNQFQTDEAEHASNNRPISLLPILSKICEHVVHQQFTNYLTTNKLLSTHQNGNKQYHSTETLGLQITDEIFNAMDHKEITAMILLDLSIAYDGISHSLLVAKLESIGVSGITWDWFISYLKDRKQHVRTESHLSEPLPVNYGVPQGSILHLFCLISIPTIFALLLLLINPNKTQFILFGVNQLLHHVPVKC